MIPLRIASQSEIRPLVTRVIVLVLAIGFALQAASPRLGDALVRVFGFVPARFFDPSAFDYSRFEVLTTLITSQLLHGGWVHLAGNLLYLWVFGAAIEGKVGHGMFAALYLAGGIAGSLGHAFMFPTSTIPSIGASGCIAALLGIFLVLMPRERITTLIPLVVSWILLEVPGLVLLPFWFGLQFLNGWLALRSAQGTEEVAGIAWWAHVAGFVFGLIAGVLIRLRAYNTRR